MVAVATDSFQVKDVTEWSPADVHEFLESILPGHPCADFFTYTSGYVLCSLGKEDLRRQAKSEEAANVIWAELRKCRRVVAAHGEFQASTDRGGLEGPPAFTIYVKVRQEAALEVDVLPSDTVAVLKDRVSELEGTPQECQRLVFNGVSMQDDRTLQSYNVHHGATMLLVPQLRDQGKGRPMAFSAPRGNLMVPGSKAWHPRSQHRPFVPVVSNDISRNFPVSLEFETTADSDAFAQAAQEEPPTLEIPPAGSFARGTEARVHLDPDTGGVRLDGTGNTLSPASTYEGFLHFGGRGGQLKVAEGVYAMIVPGSGLVKKQAEAEGLDKIFVEAGFDWREPGCSMCLGMNPDRLKPKERCAATSNRNFEGRQGPQGRTHLMSPAMAAAAAVTGKLKDVRALTKQKSSKGAGKIVKAALDSKEFCSQPLTLPTPETAAPAADAAAAATDSSVGGMPKFTRLEGVVAAPLPKANVDTDCIIPKQFLKTIKRTGLGKAAFFELRYEDDGVTEKPDFVLNKEPYRTAQVLVAMENFGCGSSREHAPWSISDFGIRCIIAPSFADIFFNNCFKNGMLPIKLTKDKVEELMADAEAKKKFTIDLPEQKIIREGGEAVPFDVDPFRKNCLVNGLDDIGLTLQKKDKISSYETQRTDRFPWLEGRPSGSAELRICASKGSNYYTRIAKGFLAGLAATEDRPERPAASEVLISATGVAIERAVRTAQEVQASGEATIASVKTDFVKSPGSERQPCVPQILIKLEAKPKAQAVAPVGGKAGGEGCGCESKKTDW